MDLGIDIQGNLFPNPLTMVTQLLATLLIFLMFKKFLWKPVHEILAKRAQAMQGELEDARQTRAAAENYLAQAKGKVEEAQVTSKQIVSAARDEADKLRESIVSDADARAKSRIEAAEAEIAQKEREMRAELQDEVADLALLATEALLHEKVDEKRDREFVESFLKGK